MKIKISLTVILFILGFFIVLQLKAYKSASEKLYTQSESELATIISQINVENDALQKEISDYKFRIEEYKIATKSKRTLLNEAHQNLEMLKVTSGIVKTEGRGLKIVIDDVEKTLNNYDLLDLLNELRSSGSEAEAINNLRIGTNTFIEEKNYSVYINNDKITRPYIIECIGDTQTLRQGLQLPGGTLGSIKSLNKISVEIYDEDRIVLPEVKEGIVFKYAKPVE